MDFASRPYPLVWRSHLLEKGENVRFTVFLTSRGPQPIDFMNELGFLIKQIGKGGKLFGLTKGAVIVYLLRLIGPPGCRI